jgi:hypothetical protein
VSRLTVTAGVVLAISGLNTFLQGLYTIDFWQGWLVRVTGAVVAGTAALLICDIPAQRSSEPVNLNEAPLRGIY